MKPTRTAKKVFQFIRETDLHGHLENQQPAEDEKAQQKQVKHITIAIDSEEDAVLDEALSILKDLQSIKIRRVLADSHITFTPPSN